MARLAHAAKELWRGLLLYVHSKRGILAHNGGLKWREQHLGSYKDSDPLFCVVMPGGAGKLAGVIGSQMSQISVWWMFKNALKNVGINRENMTFHKLRASFKSIMIAADCDEEVREVLMGHAPPGSQKNYFEFHYVEMALKEYKKADWSRAGTHRLDKLEQDNKELRGNKAAKTAASTIPIQRNF